MAFSFGAPSTTTATGAGFSLGGATAGQPGGFSFGAAKPAATGQPAANPAGGFAGFGLSAPATATTTTAAAGGGAGFNFGGLAGAASKAAPAAGGFSFGGTTAAGTTPASQPAPTAGGAGFNFAGLGGGSAATTSTAAAPALGGTGTAGFSLTAPASTATAGFSLTAPASTAPKVTAAPSAGLSFGLTGVSSAASGTPSLSTTQPSTSTATTSAASITSGFGFGLGQGAAATSTAAATGTSGFSFGGSSQASTSAPSLGGAGLSFGKTATSSLTPASGTAGLASTASAGAGPKQMTFRQLEDTITKWSTELEEQEKFFLDQATQVNAWDRIVMDNGDKIIQLNKSVEKVKLDQQKLDHELDFVHSQQRELEELLVPLEQPLDSLPPISYQQHADLEREHTYMLAESLDAQLKRMGQDLKEIIERLNSNNSKPDEDDPVQQITKILNAHVVSLMWVDRNTANLQKRFEDISKQMDIEKREQERNFRLAYS